MHRIFIRHIAQNFLTYVSMPAKSMCNLPNKSTAHLDDIRFLELPYKASKKDMLHRSGIGAYERFLYILSVGLTRIGNSALIRRKTTLG